MVKRLVLLTVVVAVLAGAALIADRVIHQAAERRATERVAEELDADVDVDLRGWPVGLRILTGRVPRAEVTAWQVHLEEEGAVLDRLDVTLRDIRLSLDDVRSPPDVLPPAAAGWFEARLSGDATWALAVIPRAIADLRIEDGAIRLRTPLGEAAADVIVRGGDVLIVPRTPLGVLLATDIELDVSDQPGAPVVEQAHIDDDVLVLRGTLRDLGGQADSGGDR